MGTFQNVEKFEDFQYEAQGLFKVAFLKIIKNLAYEPTPIIGGHSLGGLLALKASTGEGLFQHIICVGLGRISEGKTHLYNTPFFKDTMHMRSQLVSASLHPEYMLPWISKEKKI